MSEKPKHHLVGKKNRLMPPELVASENLRARVKSSDKEFWKKAAAYANKENIQGITGLSSLVIAACNEKSLDIMKEAALKGDTL